MVPHGDVLCRAGRSERYHHRMLATGTRSVLVSSCERSKVITHLRSFPCRLLLLLLPLLRWSLLPLSLFVPFRFLLLLALSSLLSFFSREEAKGESISSFLGGAPYASANEFRSSWLIWIVAQGS